MPKERACRAKHNSTYLLNLGGDGFQLAGCCSVNSVMCMHDTTSSITEASDYCSVAAGLSTVDQRAGSGQCAAHSWPSMLRRAAVDTSVTQKMKRDITDRMFY